MAGSATTNTYLVTHNNNVIRYGNYCFVRNANTLVDGLISYWKLNNSSQDSKGFYNGTDTNITYTTGVHRECAEFNGTAKISCGDITELDNATEFTFSCWFMVSNPGLTQTICARWDYGTDPCFVIDIEANEIRLFIADDPSDTGDNYITSSGFDVTADEWIHLTVTFFHGTVSIYKNGVTQTDVTILVPNLTDSSASFTLGDYSETFGGITQQLNGSLDEVGLWNRTLTAAEVAELYAKSTYPFNN